MISSTSLVLTLSHLYSQSDSSLYKIAVSLQTAQYKWLKKLILISENQRCCHRSESHQTGDA